MAPKLARRLAAPHTPTASTTSAAADEHLPSKASLARRPIADETVAVGHSHLRQRLCVHGDVLADDAVEVEEIGTHRVDLLVLERKRIGERHRASDIVEDRRGVWPIAAHGA